MQISPFGWLSNHILRRNPASYFDSCSEITLYLFIKALTTGELYYLIKSGKPTLEQLKQAWKKIFAEYTELSENKQSTYLLSLLREYYSIPNKIKIIQAIIDGLKEGYNKELIEKLRLLGFRHAYSEQTYIRDLQITVTQSKGLLIKWEQLKKDWENLESSNSKAEPNDYDLILSELSKYQGYRLDPMIITVSEFCAIIKRFKIDNKPKK